ncbi:DUF982 domain-containing protein [Mesorhizobium waimense]|uniref:DUF982 domain-containing protein n=1 Tax=Mesorhizobium waimense TaxID=1300307 RepID=A0A3A5KSN2_9HYPH|nr:DUF982 domain-containing protein [Mesorhizobium waimense]RJT39187.1 DUF982 domain-containing protein [Mesorhizobium waimense]
MLSVSSAHQASGLLAGTDWPAERTALHRVAFETAEKVLEGSRSTVDGRASFEEAAREAGVLVDPELEVRQRMYFESGVKIRPYGKSSVRDVKSVDGACEVLVDWPHAKRGPDYQSAREVVQAALDGKATPDQAREAFAVLAADAGILVGSSPA